MFGNGIHIWRILYEFFLVVVAAKEQRGWIQSKGTFSKRALSRDVRRFRNWTSVCKSIKTKLLIHNSFTSFHSISHEYLVLFLFCVTLCFILRDASCFKVFPCPLSSCFFFLLALWSSRLWKRELVCVLLVHLFVCFVRVSFYHFPLSFGVADWLRFVIVALPGLVY